MEGEGGEEGERGEVGVREGAIAEGRGGRLFPLTIGEDDEGIDGNDD